MNHRYEFVYLFDCTNGNPNGDPDAANSPRVDPQDMHGLVTDVCLKRKVRNFVEIAKSGSAGFEIFIQQGAVLNDRIEEAHAAARTGNKISASQPSLIEGARQQMCSRFYDVRTFGAVMTTGSNAGRVRGPVQLSFARSIDPVFTLDLLITRMAVTEAKKDTAFNQTMGRKPIIPYGLFRCHGFISAHLAAQTGFGANDLDLLWSALAKMFDHDHSANRGEMHARRLVVFEHESALGNAPAHRLLELVSVRRNAALESSGRPPRAFDDYQIVIGKDKLPARVKMLDLI